MANNYDGRWGAQPPRKDAKMIRDGRTARRRLRKLAERDPANAGAPQPWRWTGGVLYDAHGNVLVKQQQSSPGCSVGERLNFEARKRFDTQPWVSVPRVEPQPQRSAWWAGFGWDPPPPPRARSGGWGLN